MAPSMGETYGRAFLRDGQIYIVYRLVAPNKKVPIGELVERRRTERSGNGGDMLRLARKLYSSSTFESLEITVEPAQGVAPLT